MDPRLQLRVQRYGWDAAAQYYDAGWSNRLKPAHDSLLEAAGLAPGQEVLETACGTGLVTQRIAQAVAPGGRVTATDLSQNMVQKLGELAEKNRLTNIEARRMGAEALDFDDAAFDRALCALGLMYVPDPAAALGEMIRVVRPGGRVAATVWGERRNCGWADVFPIVDARVASEVCPMFFATGAKGALVRDFQSGGLKDLHEVRWFQTLRFGDAEDVLTSVLLGGPVALAVKRFSKEIWAEVGDEFLASVADFRLGDGQYDIPGEFVTVSGVR
jgi:SAM-dependent methyltransferase